MNYKKIKVQFRKRQDIKKAADSFRKEFGNDTIPVDIEKIIELKLGMSIVPTKSLMAVSGADALITTDWNLIYVDYDKFLDERFENRLRFTFAHEIGHYILHKNIYNSFEVKEIKDYYNLFKDIPQIQYNKLETQAMMFASYLLIPRETLVFQRSKILKTYDSIARDKMRNIDERTLNSYLANPLSNIFGVSGTALEVALNEIAEK